MEIQKLRSRSRLHLVVDNEYNSGCVAVGCSTGSFNRSRLCLFGYSRTQPRVPQSSGTWSKMEHIQVSLWTSTFHFADVGALTLIRCYHDIGLALENLDPGVLL